MDDSQPSQPKGLRILVLDGGDARCMSQLYILREFMYRLEYKKGRKILPCEYFDLIVATDGSSLIASLLGLLWMTVEEAQDAFYKAYTDVLGNSESSPEERARLLNSATRSLLKEKGIAENAMLLGEAFTKGCKVTLCYCSATRMDHCRMFRNYQSSQAVATDVTFVEAIMASSATPEIISSISIGPKGREEEVLSAAYGFSNPTQLAIKEAYHTFGPETRISCLLSLGSGDRGVITVKSEGRGNDLAAKTSMDCQMIAEELQGRLKSLRVYYRFSVDKGLEGLERFTEGFGVIKTHADAYVSKTEPSEKLQHCLEAAEGNEYVRIEQLYRINSSGEHSMHGLPPLSAFFVMRKKPMQSIVANLLERWEPKQKILVVSGLGGSGKTQLVLKFARDFKSSYRHILFIDASSSANIERGIIARVRAIKRGQSSMTMEDAINVLEYPDDEVTKDWLMILDNADDHQVNLTRYFPSCDHGSILITTRNLELGNLAPGHHVKLEAMDHEEAVEVLISSMFPPISQSSLSSSSKNEESVPLPTQRDREAAATIVKELHHLPIAVTQAGCYIKQNQCLHQYLDLLHSNRAKILKRAPRVHLDRLKYDHSVYASFDIILNSIKPRAVQLLGILSFFHFANFPRPLFAIGAKSGFLQDEYDLLDRTPEFQSSIQLLKEVLCPTGTWEEDEVNQLLEELQRYSIITLVPTHAIVTLRLHPLAHSWARDRMNYEEQKLPQAAAVRLLVSGITPDDDFGINEYLLPHISPSYLILDALHVNDQAAISRLIRHDTKFDSCLTLWTSIHERVEKVYGSKHVRTSRASLGLAYAYSDMNEHDKAVDTAQSVIDANQSMLGRNHIETAASLCCLTRVLQSAWRYPESELVGKESLRILMRSFGLHNRYTADGFMDLAKTFEHQYQYEDEEALRSTAVAIRIKVLGRFASGTVTSLDKLAQCNKRRGEYQKAEDIQKEVLEIQQKLYGESHLTTVAYMTSLAQQYHYQGRYEEAQQLRKVEVDARKRLQGYLHRDTLTSIEWLARACFALKRYPEAGQFWQEGLEGYQILYGNRDTNTLNAMYSLGRVHFDQEKYHEAEKWWKQWLEGCRGFYGSEHAETLNAMYWVPRAYYEQKRYKEAEPLFMEWLGGCRAYYGDQNGETLNGLFWAAAAIFDQDRYKEAETMWREWLEGCRGFYGEYHDDTLSACHWLARACFSQEKYQEAAELWSREADGRRKIQGDSHDATIMSINWLARAYFELKDYGEAEKLWKEELAARKIRNERPLTFRILFRLSIMWRLTGNTKAADEATEDGRHLFDGFTADDHRELEDIKTRDKYLANMEKYLTTNKDVVEPSSAVLVPDSVDIDIDLAEEIDATDPGEEAGAVYESQMVVTPPIARPRSPFEMREKFRGRPNSWSMF